MEEWRTYKLDELIDFQNGYAFKSEHFTEKGEFKIIKIKELKNGFVKFFDDTASIDITNSDLGYFEKFYVQKGDVLFALTGDPVSKPNELSWVGRVSIYNKTEKALLNQRTCKIVNKGNKVNTQYLYYYFRQPDVLYSLASRAKGSASQANLSTKDIGNLSITLPPRYVQDTIADILGSLDYKIHINCQINDNLTSVQHKLAA
ncbi:MAG: restriction endonuclease subunit S [Bacteroidales bacterium]|nr:restriction endonuclease subunit S [Bacteroidales bacterium]